MKSPRRVLILGGTGLLGPPVTRAFLDHGDRVWLFNRGTHPERAVPGAVCCCGDRARPDDLAMLDDVSPDVVVDTAGFFPATTRATLTHAGRRARIAILVSSIAVYAGIPRGALLDEDSATGAHPVWGPIGVVKRDVEKAFVGTAAGLRVPAVVLRPTHLASFSDAVAREATLRAAITAGSPICIPDDGAARLQLVSVEDLASVIVCLSDRAASVTACYNVASRTIATIAQWVTTVAAAVGMPAALRFERFTWALRHRFPYWPGDVLVDPSRLEAVLGRQLASPVPGQSGGQR